MLQDNFPIKITAPVFKVRGTDERLLVNSAIELFFSLFFPPFSTKPSQRPWMRFKQDLLIYVSEIWFYFL